MSKLEGDNNGHRCPFNRFVPEHVEIELYKREIFAKITSFSNQSIVSLANQVHRLLDRVYGEGADMLNTYLVHVCPDFWVVFCS